MNKTKTNGEIEGGSYVGMSDCFYCGECKHLLLDRRLRNSLPKNAVYDDEPCDKCKELMTQGIIFISVRDGEESQNPYRTGGFWVIKDDAVKKFISGDMLKTILKKRMCFIPDEICYKIGLKKHESK